MASANASERVIIAQLAAHEKWARTSDRSAATAAARAALDDRWEREVDPDQALPPEERARRAAHARKAHMKRMALKSAQARRARSHASKLEAEVAELAAQDGR